MGAAAKSEIEDHMKEWYPQFEYDIELSKITKFIVKDGKTIEIDDIESYENTSIMWLTVIGIVMFSFAGLMCIGLLYRYVLPKCCGSCGANATEPGESMNRVTKTSNMIWKNQCCRTYF